MMLGNQMQSAFPSKNLYATQYDTLIGNHLYQNVFYFLITFNSDHESPFVYSLLHFLIKTYMVNHR